MKRNLLFVTYQNEHFDEGLSYAIDLAKTLGKDISILMVQERKRVSEKFSDIMAAAAFAEAGEHATARAVASGAGGISLEEKVAALSERCRKGGVEAAIYTDPLDAVSAVRKFLKQQSAVDMVLLGPSATEDGNVTARELNSLVKGSTRPVVTITKHAYVA